MYLFHCFYVKYLYYSYIIHDKYKPTHFLLQAFTKRNSLYCEEVQDTCTFETDEKKRNEKQVIFCCFHFSNGLIMSPAFLMRVYRNKDILSVFNVDRVYYHSFLRTIFGSICSKFRLRFSDLDTTKIVHISSIFDIFYNGFSHSNYNHGPSMKSFNLDFTLHKIF